MESTRGGTETANERGASSDVLPIRTGQVVTELSSSLSHCLWRRGELLGSLHSSSYDNLLTIIRRMLDKWHR